MVIGRAVSANPKALRFGRDFLRVGLYMETLREQGIRLIARNDGVDSANGNDDFIHYQMRPFCR